MKKHDKSKPLVVIQCYEDRQQTLPLRRAEQPIPPPAPFANGHAASKRDSIDHPPPPPPMPTSNGTTNGEHKQGEEINQLSKKLSSDIITNSISNGKKNGTLIRTPTPDYSNFKTDSSTTKIKSSNGEKVELDSLESFKLKNPSNGQPKPPSNYFVKAPNGTATMKKHGRPVSVTIGEYASGGGGHRREPSKLEFLNGDRPDGAVPDEESISNRLQSELTLTLSRSNLRKKTEALVDAGR